VSRFLRPQLNDPGLVLGLVLILLIRSTPSLVGLTVVPTPSGPTITADICHPFHTWDRSPSVVLLGSSSSCASFEGSLESSPLNGEDRTVVSRLNEGPDPRPPKLPS
jgi:hypothetical protein